MEKQLLVLDKEIELLKKDSFVKGIMLIGSVSYGIANKYSDLDLIVLCDKDQFVVKEVDGITVEIHYSKYETLLHRLESNPIEVYKYLYSKIILDNGSLKALIEKAKNIYQNYQTPIKEKDNIKYWLKATKIKLISALENKDELKLSYLLSTNTWKLLEGLFAINNKPMPPSSLTYYLSKDMNIELDYWFTKLLIGNVLDRAESMIKLIDFVNEKL